MFSGGKGKDQWHEVGNITGVAIATISIALFFYGGGLYHIETSRFNFR